MADIWSLIGVILGSIFVVLLVSSVQVDDERENSGHFILDYDYEDVLLDDLEARAVGRVGARIIRKQN